MNKYLILGALLIGSGQAQQPGYCQLPISGDGRIYTVSNSDRPGWVPSGSYATLVCGERYSVAGGAVTSYCLNGVWQASFGSCQLNAAAVPDCTQNLRVPNGRLVATGTPFQYRLQCNSGFSVVGNNFVFCSNDGTASTPGRCELPTTTTSTTARPPQPIVRTQILCYSSSVDNGVIAASSIATTEGSRYGHMPGSTINLTCNRGYALVGPSTAACRVDGYWSQALGFCILQAPTTTTTSATTRGSFPLGITDPPQFCYVPEIANGVISMTSSGGNRVKLFHRILPGTIVTLTCDEGYALAYGNGQALCRTNGAFSANIGECIPKTTTSRTPPTTTPALGTLLLWLNSLIGSVSTTTTRQSFAPTTTTPSPVQLGRQLVEAARLCNAVDARTLLSSRANTEQTDNQGQTPLLIAASIGCMPVAKLLVEAGANLEAIDRTGHTPLLVAASKGQQEIVKLLVETGVFFDVENNAGQTAMLMAAEKGFGGIVGLLLNFGADVTDRDNNLATPLMLGAKNGFIDVVLPLLQSGADVNALDVNRQSPLMWAARNGHAAIITLLLQNGADRTLRDVNGNTAEQLARQNGHTSIAAQLQANTGK